MRNEQFLPSSESEARLLLLISAFSRGRGALEGRTKLAKLDFFLRYPKYLQRALMIRNPAAERVAVDESDDLDSRMVRYRYGPWDPAYYAVLGRLIGKGLVDPVPFNRGVAYKATLKGRELAERLGAEPAWLECYDRTKTLKRHFDIAGTSLKAFIYDHFPEVTQAEWGERL